MSILTILAGTSAVLGFLMAIANGAPIGMAFIAATGVCFTAILCSDSKNWSFNKDSQSSD